MPTFTVRGHKVRSASTRRYLVFVVKRDRWCVQDEVAAPSGYTYHEVARDPVTGFRAIFETEAEAVAKCGPGQRVAQWSKAGAQIFKRSDSYQTARRHALSVGGGVVIDASTGEEITG